MTLRSYCNTVKTEVKSDLQWQSEKCRFFLTEFSLKKQKLSPSPIIQEGTLSAAAERGLFYQSTYSFEAGMFCAFKALKKPAFGTDDPYTAAAESFQSQSLIPFFSAGNTVCNNNWT